MTRTYRAAVAMVTSCALVLSACSTSTEVAVQQAARAPPLSSMQMAEGFPDDTPSLRTVVFDVSVTGKPENVLSDDGSGFIVVRSDRMEDPVKLEFRNGEKVAYSLPFERLEILAVGSSLICKENAFVLPADAGADLMVGAEIEAWAWGAPWLSRHGRSARVKLTGLGGAAPTGDFLTTICKNEAAPESQARDDRPEIEDVAAIAVGVILAVPLLAICVGTAGLGCAVLE